MGRSSAGKGRNSNKKGGPVGATLGRRGIVEEGFRGFWGWGQGGGRKLDADIRNFILDVMGATKGIWFKRRLNSISLRLPKSSWGLTWNE